MIEGLKPCPFCGGEPFWDYEEGGFWRVSCKKCKAKTGIEHHSWDNGSTAREEAAKDWNRRAERTANVVRHRYEFTVNDNFFHAFGGTELLCENCKKKVLVGDDYCSHCGAKLIWGEKK